MRKRQTALFVFRSFSHDSIPAIRQKKFVKRIIEPFEKALGRSSAFSWEYAGDPPNSYTEFLQSKLYIHWQPDPYTDFPALKAAKMRRRVKGRNTGSGG